MRFNRHPAVVDISSTVRRLLLIAFVKFTTWYFKTWMKASIIYIVDFLFGIKMYIQLKAIK